MRSEEAVGEDSRGTIVRLGPSNKAATAVGGSAQQLPAEHATCEDGDTCHGSGHETAMGAVAIDAGVDGDVAQAVGDSEVS